MLQPLRQWTLVVPVVAMWLLVGFTAPDWMIPFCERMGGHIEARAVPGSNGGMMNYCVFADGTECSAQEIYSRTCELPADVAPSHPLVLPNDVDSLTGPLYAMPPWSLNELVEDAPLILIGEVGPAHYTEIFPIQDGKQVTTDAFNSPLPGLPVTDFLIEVEQVIRDDGTIARKEPVVLREQGEITEEFRELAKSSGYVLTYTGDRYLFLLYRDPIWQRHIFYHGGWSRLLIDGDILRISGGGQAPLQVVGSDEPITLDEFIRFVQSQDRSAAETTLTPPVALESEPPWLKWFMALIQGFISNLPVVAPE